ncbi:MULTISPECIES: VanZ family protein [Actinoalloteichus]|uniref:VanZ family protein n=1 Tax=Actinoalloteichus TaxID=65496 RepID=UPI000AAF5271|nr:MULTISPECIES: VanZ family protein [Actinoalloteichus]
MSLRQLLFPLAVLISLVVFFMPAGGVPSAPPGTDKVVHGAVFAMLAVTGLLAAVSRLPLSLGLVGYACLTEVLQAVLPLGRSGDPWDVLADLVGLGIGWGLVRFGGRLASRRSSASRADPSQASAAPAEASATVAEAPSRDLNAAS